ncbi:MAG: adenylate/guanylate cyclase domain-containing protein [Actinobacteria bacterium]|nr:adenylate/guanylate cyclase domain-containing protein [Actinomycetota bacterium]
MDGPPIRYARAGDVHLAYQVMGEGPDLVLLSVGGGHLEMQWEFPPFARFLSRLARFSRLIMFDARGSGLSDRASHLPVLENQIDDVLAVMDAAGSERGAVLGMSQTGAMAALFAASHPDRCAALLLYGAFARAAYAPDYPWGRPPELFAAVYQLVEQTWGQGLLPDLMGAGAEEPGFREWWARFQRGASSPAAFRAFVEMWGEIDVRAILPTIRVPTLILHRTEDAFRDVQNGRFLAEHIPGARLAELPGRAHLPYLGDTGPILEEIEEFLTGARHAEEPDRVLATLLFVDIVESARRAAEVGDRAWRQTQERFARVCDQHVESFRGRLVKSMGDGFLASFDGPARAVRCARAIADAVRRLGLEVRAGIHTGECERIGEDLSGIAVHIGARVAGLAGPGEVLASSTVRDLVAGSGLEFEDRGLHGLKGVPGNWHLFAVAS